MAGTFTRGIDQLLAQVPEHTKMGVTVDQVYAHYQHEGVGFHHPDGGGPFYLRDPLYGKAREYLGRVAHGLIGGHGVDIRKGMIEAAEDLSMEVYLRAPWEFGDLRASGHPWVEEDGVRVYDRPPNCRRLDPEELAIKSHLRYLFDPHRYGGR